MCASLFCFSGSNAAAKSAFTVIVATKTSNMSARYVKRREKRRVFSGAGICLHCKKEMKKNK